MNGCIELQRHPGPARKALLKGSRSQMLRFLYTYTRDARGLRSCVAGTRWKMGQKPKLKKKNLKTWTSVPGQMTTKYQVLKMDNWAHFFFCRYFSSFSSHVWLVGVCASPRMITTRGSKSFSPSLWATETQHHKVDVLSVLARAFVTRRFLETCTQTIL